MNALSKRVQVTENGPPTSLECGGRSTQHAERLTAEHRKLYDQLEELRGKFVQVGATRLPGTSPCVPMRFLTPGAF